MNIKTDRPTRFFEEKSYMATITPYIAKGTTVGQKIGVKVHKLVWFKVGDGTVEVLSGQEVKIGGKLKFMGYDGDLTIHLKLDGTDPTAVQGPCCLQLNSHKDERAKYLASSNMLTVHAVLGGRKQSINIRRVERGTQTECELSGHINETVHLDPA
jgi:hypothetical protein